MRRGYFYQHEANRDVAIEVLRSFYVPEKRIWKLRIRWWNVVPSHLPIDLLIEERVEIPREVDHKWRCLGRAPVRGGY